MLKFILSITIVLVANASIQSEPKLYASRRFLSDARAKEHLVWEKAGTRWGGNTAHKKIQSGFDDSVLWEKIVAPDGAAGDELGFSLAISNSFVAVSSHCDDDNGVNSGSVYLYRTDGVYIQKLVVPDGAAYDYFGNSLAMSADVIAVASVGDDDNGDSSGSVYLYRTDELLIEKLVAPDGEAEDKFGQSLAMSADVIAVYSQRDDDNGVDSGSVYLYRTDGVFIQKLIAPDGAAGDGFGFSLAISNTFVAVGSVFDGDNGDDSGSVYLYRTDGVFIEKLVAHDGAANDWFGYSLAMSADVIAVGSRYDDDNGDNSGSVYLYRTDGVFIQKLVAPDGAANDWFGYSLAMSADVIAAGSPTYMTNSCYV